MIHPHTELQFISDEIGHGVVATQFIPKGTITWVYDKLDRAFSPADVKNMDPLCQNILNTYSYRDNKGQFVLCWDNGRYVNHSFKSNCMSTAYDFELAIRDIHPGEQLTDDYGYLNVSEPFHGVDEGMERKIVYPDDLKKYYKKWDAQIAGVFHRITELDQPLRSMISKELWDKIKQIIEGEKELDSILLNYYDGDD